LDNIYHKLFPLLIVLDKQTGEIIQKVQNPPFDKIDIKSPNDLSKLWEELFHLPLSPLVMEYQDFSILRNTTQDYIFYTLQHAKPLISLLESSKNNSLFDSLTGCYTKKELQEFIAQYLAQFLRYKKEKFSIIMFDIDFFKRINDTHGHLCGDHILKELASLVKETLRTADICARFGGEEFVIVLQNTNIAGALKLAERIRQKIQKHIFTCKNTDLSITISLGVTSVGMTDSYYSLIERVDKALYLAKNKGRNLVEYQ